MLIPQDFLWIKNEGRKQESIYEKMPCCLFNGHRKGYLIHLCVGQGHYYTKVENNTTGKRNEHFIFKIKLTLSDIGDLLESS